MVRGCMSAVGVGNVVFIEGTMNETVYLYILKDYIRESAQKLNLDNHFYFREDNDPKQHCSRYTYVDHIQ